MTRSQPWTRPRTKGLPCSAGTSTVRPASAPDRTLRHTARGPYGGGAPAGALADLPVMRWALGGDWERVRAVAVAELDLELEGGEGRGECLLRVGARYL